MVMLIRPVRMEDHAEVLGLAREAGIGMTSLPPDADVLHRKITHSVASFNGACPKPKEESFLFVLEDTQAKKLVGTTGVVAHVGMSRPFYSYKISTIVQAAGNLGIYSLQKVLHMVNDYTGASEIGSLFLLPQWRRDGIGRFLSRCRYLMLAEFPGLFDEIVISEIRGSQDAQGDSPFYHHLAKHFFQMDFKKADYLSATQGSQFIADLMPKYPIYVNLLAKEAQAVIGQPLEASKPAMEMLQYEGFRYQGYIDVFDAGPTLEVERAKIRTVRRSRRSQVENIAATLDGPQTMIASTALADFRITQGAVAEAGEGVAITQDTARKLGVQKGDFVRYALGRIFA